MLKEILKEGRWGEKKGGVGEGKRERWNEEGWEGGEKRKGWGKEDKEEEGRIGKKERETED